MTMTKSQAQKITSLKTRQQFANCSRRLDEYTIVFRDYMRKCDRKKLNCLVDGFVETLQKSKGLAYDLKTDESEITVVAMLALMGFMQADIALYNQLFDEAKEVLK